MRVRSTDWLSDRRDLWSSISSQEQVAAPEVSGSTGPLTSIIASFRSGMSDEFGVEVAETCRRVGILSFIHVDWVALKFWSKRLIT